MTNRPTLSAIAQEVMSFKIFVRNSSHYSAPCKIPNKALSLQAIRKAAINYYRS